MDIDDASPQFVETLTGLFDAYYGFVGAEAYVILGFVALLWLVELANMVSSRSLSGSLGIAPRKLRGLVGIPFAPLLHAGPGHAFGNTPPLLTLGSLVAFQDDGRLALVSAAIILFGGAGTWLVARGDRNHVGASGLIFGYFGYILARGLYGGDSTSLLIAVAVMLMYGGFLFDALPKRGGENTSWEGHLIGAIGGILAALWVSGAF